jgi:hypothetical protein
MLWFYVEICRLTEEKGRATGHALLASDLHFVYINFSLRLHPIFPRP